MALFGCHCFFTGKPEEELVCSLGTSVVGETHGLNWDAAEKTRRDGKSTCVETLLDRDRTQSPGPSHLPWVALSNGFIHLCLSLP